MPAVDLGIPHILDYTWGNGLWSKHNLHYNTLIFMFLKHFYDNHATLFELFDLFLDIPVALVYIYQSVLWGPSLVQGNDSDL